MCCRCEEPVERKVLERMDKIAPFCKGGIVLNIRNMSHGAYDPSAYVSQGVWPKVIGLVGGIQESLELSEFPNLMYLCLTAHPHNPQVGPVFYLPEQPRIKALKLCNTSMYTFSKFAPNTASSSRRWSTSFCLSRIRTSSGRSRGALAR